MVAARNIDRARRRWEPAPVSPISVAVGPPALPDGPVHQLPSDDDLGRNLPQGALFARPPFCVVASSTESEPGNGVEEPSANVQTPKRRGEDSDAPTPQRPRAESRGDRG